MLASHAKQSEKLVWECFDVIIPETSTMNKETQLKLKTQNIHFFFIICISNVMITLMCCSGMVMKKVFFFRSKIIGIVINIY